MTGALDRFRRLIDEHLNFRGEHPPYAVVGYMMLTNLLSDLKGRTPDRDEAVIDANIVQIQGVTVVLDPYADPFYCTMLGHPVDEIPTPPL